MNRMESFAGGSLAAGKAKNTGEAPREVPYKRTHFSPAGRGLGVRLASLPGKNLPVS